MSQALFDGHYIDVDAEGVVRVVSVSLKEEFEAFIQLATDITAEVVGE